MQFNCYAVSPSLSLPLSFTVSLSLSLSLSLSVSVTVCWPSFCVVPIISAITESSLNSICLTFQMAFSPASFSLPPLQPAWLHDTFNEYSYIFTHTHTYSHSHSHSFWLKFFAYFCFVSQPKKLSH